MKYIWYIFTKDQPIVEFNQDKFESAAMKLWEKGYEYIQTFNHNDIIAYNTLVIEWFEQDRLDIVRGLYWVHPWQIRERDGEMHAIFRFLKPIQKKAISRIGECLAEMYNGNYQYHTFFSKSSKIVETDSDCYTNPQVVTQYFDEIFYSDSVNHAAEKYVNDNISITSIQEKLPWVLLLCDEHLNIAIGYWKVFKTVYTIMSFSLNATYAFFNKHFAAGFKTDDNKQYLNWVVIKTSELVEHDWWLASLDDKWWYKWVTDFIIRVYYKIKKPEWDVWYIVRLTNKYWETTDYIEWRNSANEWEMIKFVQAYGNYHCNATKAHLKAIHAAIANTEVPVIIAYSEYGINNYKWERVLILPDGIMNVESKRLFLKEQWDSYLSLGWKDAITVIGNTEHVDWKTMCRFNWMVEHQFEEYMNLTKSIYSDLSGDMIPLMACSMAGYMAYESYIKEAPLYFVTGVSGSGKSTFVEILGWMFWVTSFIKLSSTTVLPLKYLLSSGSRLPIFLSEYRANMDYKSQKEALIRETFDWWEIQRWQRDGRVNKYKLSAQLFIEGEDIYSSGSIRTRTIMHRTSSAGRIMSIKPQEVIRDNKELLTSFLYSYITKTNKSDYDKYIDEWYKIFGNMWAEPRVVSNMQIMYAGCMAFAPHMKEYFIEKITQVLKYQIQDFEQNSVTRQFLKVMGQYTGSRFARYYTDLWYTYFNWNDIVEFCEKSRKILDNSLDSYRCQLVEFWFESWFFEVEWNDDFWSIWKVMIDAVRIRTEKLPNELLSNPKLYQTYRLALTK